MKVIIVESPTKAKTISRFLERGYLVSATMGHVRDLPQKRFGVKVIAKGDGFIFKPQYVSISKKKETIDKLKKLAKEEKEIILATDPDREGEAIAFHAAHFFKDQKISRIVFHEITRQAIEKALKNPRQINMDLVDAQQARRILDRVVGYKLSPLLWRKIRQGLSAGRVQSVAVRLIVEREREREKFKKEKFFRVAGNFKNKANQEVLAQLTEVNGQKINKTEKISLFAGNYSFQKTTIDTPQKAEEVIDQTLAEEFLIKEIREKVILRRPLPPFTTSTLQQTASRRFGWSSRMTMKIAQSLYEKGLITYHRTDSLSLSTEAIAAMRNLIGQDFGKQYLPEKEIFYKTRSKLAQEAHEAIRPTHVENKPESQAEKLSQRNEAKLYELIWKRALASQMAAAKLAETQLELEFKEYLFTTKGTRLLFDGFSRVYPMRFSEIELPEAKQGEKLLLDEVGILECETQPPPRYSEAALIAALEKAGIGRPSTYAPIIVTIQHRLYVEKEEGVFLPTNLGIPVNDFLVEHFKDIVDLPFTAKMEESLDEIASGEEKWQKVLSLFWKNFIPKVEKVKEKAERIKIEAEKTGEKCPKCQKGNLVIRTGRFGKFIACDNFPECKFTKPLVEKADFNCPECQAPAIIRKTKKGRRFFGCSNFPSCKWASWHKPKP